MTFISAYVEAFLKHYPEKTLTVKSRRQTDRSWKYAVIINGDAGGILLSEADIKEATVMFNR